MYRMDNMRISKMDIIRILNTSLKQSSFNKQYKVYLFPISLIVVIVYISSGVYSLLFMCRLMWIGDSPERREVRGGGGGTGGVNPFLRGFGATPEKKNWKLGTNTKSRDFMISRLKKIVLHIWPPYTTWQN